MHSPGHCLNNQIHALLIDKKRYIYALHYLSYFNNQIVYNDDLKLLKILVDINENK